MEVPGGTPVSVVVVPSPGVATSSGCLVTVQVPVAGKPLSTTLPVIEVHVRWVMVPITGAEGIALTVSVYVTTAAEHGEPCGLLEVTVINTVFPLSEAEGVYVKLNGETVPEVCVTFPPPFSVTVTLVAVPPNVFPLTVTGVVPQVLPAVELSITLGGFMHPHETAKIPVVVTQPAEFLTPT